MATKGARPVKVLKKGLRATKLEFSREKLDGERTLIEAEYDMEMDSIILILLKDFEKKTINYKIENNRDQMHQKNKIL